MKQKMMKQFYQVAHEAMEQKAKEAFHKYNEARVLFSQEEGSNEIYKLYREARQEYHRAVNLLTCFENTYEEY